MIYHCGVNLHFPDYWWSCVNCSISFVTTEPIMSWPICLSLHWYHIVSVVLPYNMSWYLVVTILLSFLFKRKSYFLFQESVFYSRFLEMMKILELTSFIYTYIHTHTHTHSRCAQSCWDFGAVEFFNHFGETDTSFWSWTHFIFTFISP